MFTGWYFWVPFLLFFNVFWVVVFTGFISLPFFPMGDICVDGG